MASFLRPTEFADLMYPDRKPVMTVDVGIRETVKDDVLQIQYVSQGIRPDLDADIWHICYYKETADNGRDEEYYFPCHNDHQCCGRECCVPVPAGFPLWLLILLIILGLLLLLLLILCTGYYCWKYCCKKKKPPTPPPHKPEPVVVQKPRPPASPRPPPSPSPSPPLPKREPIFIPSPMEMTYETSPRPIPFEIHDQSEMTQEKRALLTRVGAAVEHKARMEYVRPFVPDPMEETVLSTPVRSQISYHHPSEISKEQFAEKTIIEQAQGKRAQVIYYIPGEDEVAAY